MTIELFASIWILCRRDRSEPKGSSRRDHLLKLTVVFLKGGLSVGNNCQLRPSLCAGEHTIFKFFSLKPHIRKKRLVHSSSMMTWAQTWVLSHFITALWGRNCLCPNKSCKIKRNPRAVSIATWCTCFSIPYVCCLLIQLLAKSSLPAGCLLLVYFKIGSCWIALAGLIISVDIHICTHTYTDHTHSTG